MPHHLLLLGLAGLPLLGAAQTPSPSPRFYVGAGATLLTSQPFNRYSDTQLGPALTVGYQLRPRVALQLSGAYTWRRGSSAYAFNYTDNAGNQVIETHFSEYRDNLFTLPVLLRGELTQPSQRLHVDAVVGTTFLLYTGSSHTTNTYQGQTTVSDYASGANLNLSLALGPALRYSLTPRLEATADALANLALTSSYYYSLSDRLFSNVLVGMRYRFGQ